MKKTMMLALAAAVGMGGTTLLVGNDKESPASLAATNAVPGATSVPAAQTNEPVKELVPDLAKAVPAPPALSPGVEEIVQLARAHVGDEVLLAYVERSTNAFALKADEILYLHDVGVPADVVAAMVRHGQDLKEPAPVAEPATSLAAVTAKSLPVATEQAPPPSSEAPPAPSAEEAAAPVAAGETQPVTYNYFYNTLSPYGNWVEVPDYGWCWQPTVAVVNAGWQPYCDNGRWLYTDCGWYWNSYYSWGWGPFHYGRWYMSPGCGWVWAPGTCWGPAWVTWRYYNGYCGWAPLPPACGYRAGFGLTYGGAGVAFGFGFGLTASHYTYVPTAQFHSEKPWVHRLPPGQATTIHGRSTVINNYASGNGNHAVINVGPGTSRIAAATHTEIHKVSLRDTGSPGATIRGQSLSRDGATLAVYRPKLPEQAARPPAEITSHQQELARRSAELAKSEAVNAANTQVRINRTVAPQRELTGRTIGNARPMSAPPAARPSSGASAGNPTPRSETPRSQGTTTAPPKGWNARPDVTPPKPAPSPPVSPRSQREEAPRADVGHATATGTARGSSIASRVDSPGRVPVASSAPTPAATRSRSESPRQAAQPQQGVRVRVSPPESMTAPNPHQGSPQYSSRAEPLSWRTPAPQPSYRPPSSPPMHSVPPAPSMPAPRSSPGYAPAPVPHASPAPASRSPMMSSPSAPPPAPAVQSRSSSGSSSRGGSGGRER
jgi:hypothetical protein